MSDLLSTLAAPRAPAHESAAGPALAPLPKTVRATGLDLPLIVELVAKSIFFAGKIHLPVLSGKLKLSVNVLREVFQFMLAEHMVEVAWRGASDLDVQYQLTQAGKQRAGEYVQRCRYVGPAPVTLDAYRAQVARQGWRQSCRITPEQIGAVFADEALDPQLRDLIGAGMHSGRSLFLYGPPGSGKTTLARKLGALLPGVVALPYALAIDQHIVQIHDPQLHLAPPQRPGAAALDPATTDARWVWCQRPALHVGAELGPDMLDLRCDPAGGTFQAPPHLKANNGLFIVDDLGRQRISSADLLNRWIGPLDQGIDQLSLGGGHKVALPFDVLLVFATNLTPRGLLDDAFMRRLGYKIHIGPLSEASYRLVFRRQCRVARIVYDEAGMDYLLEHLHRASGRPLLACYPHELLGRIGDFASFAGLPPRLSKPALEQAWASMFAGAVCEAPPARPVGAALFETIQ